MKIIKLLVKNKKITVTAAAVVALAAIFLMIVSLFGSQEIKAADTVKLSELTKAQDITLIAHRGLSSQAPENTIPAFELAAKKGFKTVEFDIQPTKDGVWVLSHDDTLQRMTDGHGKIADRTYYDLADFTVDNGANIEKYKNLKMPSLDDALECCLKNGLAPVIEIEDFDNKSIKRLSRTVINYGFEDSCQIVSFNHEALEAVKKENPNFSLVYLVTELDDDKMTECLENPDMGVSFKADPKHNSTEKVKKLLSNDMKLYCGAVDGKDNLDYYYKAGVRSFVSDIIIP